MSPDLSIIDLVFIIFSLIFVITAFLRGFIKEIFALFNWIMAFTLSYFLTPIIAPLFYSYSPNSLVVNSVMQIMIFIATFIFTALSTATLSKSLRTIFPTAIDKSLGVFYGIVKTLLIFGFLYAVMLNIFALLLDVDKKKAAEKNPEWLVNAKSYNIIRYSGEFLDPVVTTIFDSFYKNISKKNSLNKALDNKIDEVTSQKDSKSDKNDSAAPGAEGDLKLDQLDIDQEKINEAAKGFGYEKLDIEKMNRIIDILGK